jgi:hypothetical protein
MRNKGGMVSRLALWLAMAVVAVFAVPLLIEMRAGQCTALGAKVMRAAGAPSLGATAEDLAGSVASLQTAPNMPQWIACTIGYWRMAFGRSPS